MTIEFEITSDAYFTRASHLLELFDHEQNPAILFYSALEFRYAIERLLFEYLVILKNTNLSKALEKLYSAKNLKDAILEAEPYFIDKINFTNIFLKACGINEDIKIPDLDLFNTLYGKLGRYLHAPKRPDETVKDSNWLTDFISLLNEIRHSLYEILVHPIGYFDINEKGWELFQKLKSGSMTKKEVMDHLRADLISEGLRGG